MTAPSLRERIAEALVDAAHDQHPEGMRPGDNEDCGCPWGIGEIDWLGFANAVLAVLADADPTDLGLEQIGGVAYCVMHDEMVIEGYDPMGECRRSDGCVEVPVYARLPLEEAHTVDVGHVHVLTTPGGPCASSCPHPDHRTNEETTDG